MHATRGLNEEVRGMMGHGRSRGEVVVTGSPALDAVGARETAEAGATLRVARNWNGGRLTSLWTSTVGQDHHRRGLSCWSGCLLS